MSSAEPRGLHSEGAKECHDIGDKSQGAMMCWSSVDEDRGRQGSSNKQINMRCSQRLTFGHQRLVATVSSSSRDTCPMSIAMAARCSSTRAIVGPSLRAPLLSLLPVADLEHGMVAETSLLLLILAFYALGGAVEKRSEGDDSLARELVDMEILARAEQLIG
ncbi:hypothetical protein OsI_28596 [Oryza sativa Indica Group]|uniref:Uncharacterized protein n=1 Tax=Oryza sativa subsp. indica TaxID=39946 RepID=B8B9B1_ORYSI|nr:hypothetical protein OsI_28596 [Oryza sativa Indica Group]